MNQPPNLPPSPPPPHQPAPGSSGPRAALQTARAADGGFGAWLRRSPTAKLFILGFLFLVLLIPSAMVESLVRERESLRDRATNEVANMWADAQTVAGPLLTLPYRATEVLPTGKVRTYVRYAHFLPEELQAKVTLSPEKRRRGIYDVLLYNAKIELSGRMAPPNTAALGLASADLLWDQAFLSLGLTDPRGLRRQVEIRLADAPYTFEPGQAAPLFAKSLAARLPAAAAQAGGAFQLALDLNGAQALHFLPLGRTTQVAMAGPWGTPSFVGSFLPEQRTVADTGFTAQWRVLHLNRSLPQQFLDDDPAAKQLADEDGEGRARLYSGGSSHYPSVAAGSVGEGAFGVSLLNPVDAYTKTNRAVKYAPLVLLLTFTALFFIELLAKRSIHPIQYLLIGFALVVFYVLLLALSEQLGFEGAYALASLATVLLLAAYVRSALRSGRLAAIAAGVLALLYGFFYVLLQLEDYALLVGAVGLFLLLATVMYLSRNIDWNSGLPGEAPAASGGPA